MSQTRTPAEVRNVVLVHGGFVDGSGWEGVYHAVTKDGYTVAIVQNPTTSLAGDVSAEQAAFMADSQVPYGEATLGGTISEPAWKTKPSWYLLTTEDKVIPPDAQRMMARRAGATVVEVTGSHAIYVSQPQAVVSLIETAAQRA